MTQFRLTKKFADDIKVKLLNEPKLKSNVLDDWAIDRLIIMRKKVAMITHVKSLLSFFIPYNAVGGAINIPEYIGIALSQWFYDLNLEKVGGKAIDLFNNQSKDFCKTVDHKLLGHMNDFKRCVNAYINYRDLSFDIIDFGEITDKISGMPISTTNNGYSTPKELMLGLISSKLNLLQ